MNCKQELLNACLREVMSVSNAKQADDLRAQLTACIDTLETYRDHLNKHWRTNYDLPTFLRRQAD